MKLVLWESEDLGTGKVSFFSVVFFFGELVSTVFLLSLT